MLTKNKRLIAIVTAVPLLLLIPFIAMQLSKEVVWTRSDFVIMGFLLLVTGLSIEGVLRLVASTKHRLIFGLIVLFVFFIVWAELAVGIFGTPWAGQ